MRYTIINKKIYRINDDGTLTEKIGMDLKGNLIKELRGHVEKEVKEDKIKKDKIKEDKIKNKAIIESTTSQKKKGRPKKEKPSNA